MLDGMRRRARPGRNNAVSEMETDPAGSAVHGAGQPRSDLAAPSSAAGHTERTPDEEADLFPALLEAVAGSDAVCLRELTASLAAQHRELESRWRQVRDVLAPPPSRLRCMLAHC